MPKSRSRSSKNSVNWMIPLLVIIFAAVAGFMYFQSQSNAPVVSDSTAEISVDQAYSRFTEGAYVLDVRTPQEWEEAHVEGTTLIPLNELSNRVGEIPEDREIIVVCRSGNRSQQGRDILRNAGFSQVSSMAGGLNEWRARGYPTVSGP